MNKTNLVDTSDPIYVMNKELISVRGFTLSKIAKSLYLNYDEIIELIEEVIKEKYE